MDKSKQLIMDTVKVRIKIKGGKEITRVYHPYDACFFVIYAPELLHKDITSAIILWKESDVESRLWDKGI